MTQCFIGWRNRGDTATLSGGVWTSQTLLQNKSLGLYAYAAASPSSNTVIDVDMGAVYDVRGVYLLNHNLSSTATIQLSLGTTPGGTDVYAGSAVDPWDMTFDDENVAWTTSEWWPQLATTAFVGHPWLAGWTLSQTYTTARYARISIVDTSNPDSQVRIGRLWIGSGIVPNVNRALGAIDNWVDLSRTQRTLSGAFLRAHHRRFRKSQFRLDILSAAEAAEFYEMVRRQGTVGEIMWIPDISDAAYSQQWGYLAAMRALTAIEYPFPLNRGAAFELEEIL